MSSNLKELQTCIYCKKPGESDEHLLPHALGGALVDRFVCQTCNNDLGKYDQYLAERSPVVLPRLEHATFDARLDGIWFAEVNGTPEVAHRIEKGPAHKLLPQLHCFQHTPEVLEYLYLGWEEEREAFKALVKKHAEDGFRNTQVQERPELDHTALIWSERKKLLLRTPSRQQARVFLREIQLQWDAVFPVDPQDHALTEPTVVRATITVDDHKISRAVAKIAFNMLAKVYEAERVLHPSFDSAREFIRSGNNADGVTVILMNAQQVQEWEFPFDPQGLHEVVLMISEGTTVVVDLYRTFRFKVTFWDGQIPMEAIDPELHLCSWVFSGTRDRNADQKGLRKRSQIFQSLPPDSRHLID